MLEFLQGAERDLGKKMMVEWRENSGKKVRRRKRLLRVTEKRKRAEERISEFVVYFLLSSVTNNTNIKEISACAHVASTTSLATGNKKKLHQRSRLGYC